MWYISNKYVVVIPDIIHFIGSIHDVWQKIRETKNKKNWFVSEWTLLTTLARLRLPITPLYPSSRVCDEKKWFLWETSSFACDLSCTCDLFVFPRIKTRTRVNIIVVYQLFIFIRYSGWTESDSSRSVQHYSHTEIGRKNA